MYHIVPDGFSFSFRSKWNESVYLWFLGLLSHISYVYVSISQKQTKNWGTCKQYPSYCFFFWVDQTNGNIHFFLFFFFHHVHIPFIYFEIVVDSGLRVHSMLCKWIYNDCWQRDKKCETNEREMVSVERHNFWVKMPSSFIH